jgi:hypothetical protein
MLRATLLLTCVTLASRAAEPSPTATDERVSNDARGRILIHALPVAPEFRNAWPADWEEAFVDRVNASLAASDIRPGKYGGTFFENEKASYPQAFIGFVKGQRKEALRFLQQDDDAAWSKQLTLGVDWFPCFTIRGQVRKYFFFGQYLEPAYRRRMFDSARLWTEVDPLRRPNPFWKSPDQRPRTGEGWTPEYHNSWVDVRSTDNLRAPKKQATWPRLGSTRNACGRTSPRFTRPAWENGTAPITSAMDSRPTCSSTTSPATLKRRCSPRPAWTGPARRRR